VYLLDMASWATQEFLTSYQRLDAQIGSLKRALTALRQNRRPTPVMTRTFLLAFAVTHLASLELNRNLSYSSRQYWEKAMSAAKSLVDLIAAIDLRSISCLDSVISVS
jgi:hypothetical protein